MFSTVLHSLNELGDFHNCLTMMAAHKHCHKYIGPVRVVSSEISLGKFPKIYSNLSGNLLNIFFHFIICNYNHIKK